MLRGTFDEFDLPEVLRLMSDSGRTGRLDVTRREGRGYFMFLYGEVHYVDTTPSRTSLAERLVAAGAMEAAEIEDFVAQYGCEDATLGSDLIREGAAAAETVEEAMRATILEAAFDLWRWELGEFVWEPHPAPASDVAVGLTIDELVAEVASRMEELELITKHIPSPRAVLAMAPTPPDGSGDISISADQWKLLVQADGHHSVEAIAARLGLDEFTALRTYYGLVSTGLLEVVSVGPSKADTPEPAVDGATEVVGGEPIAATPDPDEDPGDLEAEGEEPQDVDRASVARELSGLFKDEPPAVVEATPVSVGASSDSDQVSKTLISRLIDGVKSP